MVRIKKVAPNSPHKSEDMPPYDPAAICDPPELLPYDDLYEPVMVTVILINDGEDDTKFSIPRALICGRSEYFKMAFMGQFAEADEKEIWLEEVPVWVFKTFVKWLYTQRLTLHPVERPTRASAPKCGEKRRREDDGEFTLSMTISSASANIAAESEEDQQPRKKQQTAKDESQDTAVSSASSSVLPSSSKPLTVYGLETVEPEADGSIPPRAANASDEEHLNDPITCSYRSLFELYLFSDEYDTFAFRKLVLEHIQLKLVACRPRKYLPPSLEDTKFALSKLPSSSHLYKLLVELWARDIMLSSSCASRIEAVQMLEEFPKSFLAGCLVSSKAQARALNCSGGDDCDGMDHSDEDADGIFDTLECGYHEHRSEEDRRRCMAKWEKLWDIYGEGHDDEDE
ncbi:hypothetical protein HII31_11931 [Pseudocercospora fuligena]|uniref:BTB domain-containing protein n=1 Tax=Pseudocercospora fuligena TaxID=685502 RepID=A0A8H6R7T7_9PEZI|nr:hypothetical protein HII31_11931 [Pseudocercospora fuligena]